MATYILVFGALCLPLTWGKTQPRMGIAISISNISSAWVRQSGGDHTLRLRREASKVSRMNGIDKLEITRLHNVYRSLVVPPASDMEYMEWDDKVASVAQEWADQCKWKHGNPSHNFSGGLGQNLYKGWNSSGGYAMRLWYNEYVDYHFDTLKCNQGKQCGHYTQMVWSKSRLVGCGIKEGCWQDYRYYIVCNYWPPGNYRGMKPYQVGAPCTRCANDSQLCWSKACVSLSQCEKYKLSCGCDLECRNCGELDSENCTCKCKNGWKGVDCSEPCADKRMDCPQYSCQWYSNSKDHPCEKTCEVCKPLNPDDPQGTCCDGITCPPGEVLDLSNRPCECIPLCPGPKCGSSLREPHSLLLLIAMLLLGYNPV